MYVCMYAVENVRRTKDIYNGQGPTSYIYPRMCNGGSHNITPAIINQSKAPHNLQ